MKFICTVEIDKPKAEIVELFNNDTYLKDWQKGFVSKELISGVAGEKDAVSRIIFHNKKNVIELKETILNTDINEKYALYEHIYMTNTMKTNFIAVDANHTKINTEINYTKFNGLMPKLMAMLMPGMFRKQTQQMLDDFKAFAEKKL